MTPLDKAILYTLFNEASSRPDGGYTNDPDDAGGATKWGITGATLARYLCRPVTDLDVEALSRSTAQMIYRDFYWAPLNLGRVMDAAKSTAIFDAGVLFGIGVSALYAQQALASMGADVAVDGHLGPKSTVALNAADTVTFIQTFVRLLVERIGGVVKSHPQDSKYEMGWENRVRRYLDLTV